MKRLALLLALISLLFAKEPIEPIPKTIQYDAKKAALGKLLFFDPILSKDKTISCASCHDPNHGGADPRRVSIGVGGKKGKVNSPTVFNAVFNFRQFCNGRAKDLYEQANGPLLSPIEMAMSKEEVERRINQSQFYKKLFRNIYARDYITYEMVVDAIVEFEKALITPNAKFDRYLRGEAKLSTLEERGFFLFKKLGCITCHNGINLGGNSFQKMGVIIPYDGPRVGDRYEVTKDPLDKNVYKVPTLRNVALTAPYFHSGEVKTLKEAVEKMAYYNLGVLLEPQQTEAIVAFLKTLTGEKPKVLQ